MSAGTRKNALALVSCMLLAGLAAHAADAPAVVSYVSAPELRTVLEKQRGRVVVLNLWATWCTSCLREIPDLVSLERELGGRGLSVLGVAMDDPGDLDSLVRPFHAKYFPAFKSYLRREADMDALASVVDPAWNEVLPTTYLIDREGKVVGRLQGRLTLAQFRERAERALGAGR
jgi:thiol-disulfide isomerase/thioredoxin